MGDFPQTVAKDRLELTKIHHQTCGGESVRLICLGLEVRNRRNAPRIDAVACSLPHVALPVLGPPSCACFLADFCLVSASQEEEGEGKSSELAGIDPQTAPRQHVQVICLREGSASSARCWLCL
jgi:hypothetical protein